MPLLSDFEGHATEIVIATPGGAELRDPISLLKRQLGSLPRQIHPDCQIVWVCASLETPVAPFKIDGMTVLPVRVASPHAGGQGRMRWLQDPFVCCTLDAEPHWVVPSNADALARSVVEQMAVNRPTNLRQSSLHLEGGNMMQIGDVVLLGKDLAYQNGIPPQGTWLHPHRQAWETLETEICALLGVRKVVWVGNTHRVQTVNKGVAMLQETWQPLFHLDLFLLPGGLDHAGRLRLFVGELHVVEHLHMTTQDWDDIRCLRDALDEVITGLQQDLPWVEIARLPIVTTVQDGRIHVQSLCNGWVEVGSRGKHAFLPDYRDGSASMIHAQVRRAAHQAAEAQLNLWGYTVHWVDMDFAQLATEGGALHCAVKILERTL